MQIGGYATCMSSADSDIPCIISVYRVDCESFHCRRVLGMAKLPLSQGASFASDGEVPRGGIVVDSITTDALSHKPKAPQSEFPNPKSSWENSQECSSKEKPGGCAVFLDLKMEIPFFQKGT